MATTHTQRVSWSGEAENLLYRDMEPDEHLQQLFCSLKHQDPVGHSNEREILQEDITEGLTKSIRSWTSHAGTNEGSHQAEVEGHP